MNEREEIYLTLGFIQAVAFFNQGSDTNAEQWQIKDMFVKAQVIPQILNQVSKEEAKQIMDEVNKSNSYMRIINVIKKKIDKDKMLDVLKNDTLMDLTSIK